jgi:uncharacterized protein YkwD
MEPLVSSPSGIVCALPVRIVAATVLAGAGLVAGRAATAAHAGASAGDCTPAASWPAAQPTAATAALAAVNAHRATRGLAPLRVSASLTASATWKARHMAAYNYMAHEDPAPPAARSFFARVAACGYGAAASENIARWYPSPAAVVQAWLADPPHRANIEGGWSTTGIAVAVSASGIPYWVEDFGVGEGSPPPPPPQTTSTPPSTTTSARRRCVVPRVTALRSAVATRRLRQAACGVRTMRVRAPGVAVGRVAWQSPRRGVQMPAGSRVTIAVSARG